VRRGSGFDTTSVVAARTVEVMLVDGRAVMREGLRAVIEQEPDLVVVAEAATVSDAKSRDVTPDVIVADLDLADAKHGDVIVGLREVFQKTSIFVFTRVADPAEVQSALAAGASGYLLETAQITDLCAGIRAVASGRTYLHPALGVTVAQWKRDPSPGLSPQEKRVLQLLALGHSNIDIARICNFSVRTAETHRAHIKRKLNRRTRAELVEYARENGLMQLGPQ
jgi:two-component system response regulator NreC